MTVPTGIDQHLGDFGVGKTLSTSRNHTASRKASGSASMAAWSSGARVSRSRSVSGVSLAPADAPPGGGASAARSTISLSIETVSRARSRARFRAVLWRIVNNQALRFVPGWNWPAARNALRYVSCTRSSASARTRVSRKAARYKLSSDASASVSNAGDTSCKPSRGFIYSSLALLTSRADRDARTAHPHRV